MTNLSLFAQMFGKLLWMTGIGPGCVVVLGLYNFQKRFVPKILSGEKTHTIRATRANPDKPGNLLHLYTGLRHKGATLLMRALCLKVEQIEIDACGHECNCDPFVAIAGVELDASEREALAVRDGFPDFATMLEFWAGRLPFKGQIIYWQFSEPSFRDGQLAQLENRNTFGATSPSRKVRRSA